MDQREKAIQIFRSGVESVLPHQLIEKSIKLENNLLTCKDSVYKIDDFNNIYLTGFGKASAAMAQAMENLLGNKISGGHILTKYGHGVRLKNVIVSEAGHPVPDFNGQEATSKIVRIIEQASSGDLLIVLISGGGSSLMTDIPSGITLEDLQAANQLLIHSGAAIQEINAVRKHISCLKGGQLARLAYPATVLTLIISDVIGDPLDVIASGPTVADSSTFRDAWQVLDRYNLWDAMPVRVVSYLREGITGLHPETVREGDPALQKTGNMVLGNNSTALENCAAAAAGLGFQPCILSGSVAGNVNDVAEYLYSSLLDRLKGTEIGKTVLLFGGEPTVKPTGKGKGGRNQHLALLMARRIAGMQGVTFLSAGTDGTDGPTDATGAVCDGDTLDRAVGRGLDWNKAIRNFDSYPFFEAEGGLLKTGPTHTNVMDLMIVLIDR